MQANSGSRLILTHLRFTTPRNFLHPCIGLIYLKISPLTLYHFLVILKYAKILPIALYHPCYFKIGKIPSLSCYTLLSFSFTKTKVMSLKTQHSFQQRLCSASPHLNINQTSKQICILIKVEGKHFEILCYLLDQANIRYIGNKVASAIFFFQTSQNKI